MDHNLTQSPSQCAQYVHKTPLGVLDALCQLGSRLAYYVSQYCSFLYLFLIVANVLSLSTIVDFKPFGFMGSFSSVQCYNFYLVSVSIYHEQFFTTPLYIFTQNLYRIRTNKIPIVNIDCIVLRSTQRSYLLDQKVYSLTLFWNKLYLISVGKKNYVRKDHIQFVCHDSLQTLTFGECSKIKAIMTFQ